MDPQADGALDCEFNFEMPFENEKKVVLSTGSDRLEVGNIINPNKEPKVSTFLELNFPHVDKIYLTFTINASWAGNVFNTQLEGDVTRCAEVVLSKMTDNRSFVLEVQYPAADPTDRKDFKDAMLLAAKEKILEIFRAEAKKINPTCKLRIA